MNAVTLSVKDLAARYNEASRNISIADDVAIRASQELPPEFAGSAKLRTVHEYYWAWQAARSDEENS